MSVIDGKVSLHYDTIMSRSIFVVFLFVWLLGPFEIASAAKISAPYGNDTVPDISVSGAIVAGDAAKLEKLLATIENKRGFVGGPTAYVYFDGAGGSLAEALKMGRALRQHYASSAVALGKSCLGPCAWAFLGGATGFAVPDIAVSRTLSSGSKLGFYGFNQSAAIDGVDTGALSSYAIEMEVDFAWMKKVFATRADRTVHVKTVSDALQLKIGAKIDRIPDPQWKQAVNICNHATNWRRPVSSDYQGSVEDDNAPAKVLSAAEAQLLLLKQISEASTILSDRRSNPIGSHVADALASNDPEQVADVYAGLKAAGVPLIDTDGKNYLVEFEYGGGFYVKGCVVNFVTTKSNPILRAHVVLFGLGGVFEPFIRLSDDNPLFRLDRDSTIF